MPKPTASNAPEHLVWLDLEMTGLDIRRHVIVEIAVIVTDVDLNPLDEGLDLVIHATEEELAGMDDFVTKMHTKSGLINEIRASTVSVEDAHAQALAYVRSHIPTARTAPLCGNSIGADRRFLDLFISKERLRLEFI